MDRLSRCLPKGKTLVLLRSSVSTLWQMDTKDVWIITGSQILRK